METRSLEAIASEVASRSLEGSLYDLKRQMALTAKRARHMQFASMAAFAIAGIALAVAFGVAGVISALIAMVFGFVLGASSAAFAQAKAAGEEADKYIQEV